MKRFGAAFSVSYRRRTPTRTPTSGVLLQLMGKRANGEGNVYQRANGTWEARVTFVDPGSCFASTTGAPSSMRLRASFTLARTLAAVGP